MEPTGGVPPVATVASVEEQMEEGAHGVPIREAAWRGMVAMPQAEVATPRVDESWLSVTVMPLEKAVQMGPSPVGIEMAAPKMEAA